MAIYKVNHDKFVKIEETTFHNVGMKERQDLQRILKDSIEIIAPDTLVIAEEFGLMGSLAIIALFAALVWRALVVARESAESGRLYQANLAFGFAVWQAMQVFINLGVNMGILPTKGLTLPLISYGRSSLVVTLIGLGLLLRIDCENRQLATVGKRTAPRKTGTRKRAAR